MKNAAMKHLVSLVVILALALLVAAPAFADSGYEAVVTHGVNFRDASGNLISFLDENGNRVSLITKGHVVRVYEIKNGRAEIEFQGIRGNILNSITRDFWICYTTESLEHVEKSDGSLIQTIPKGAKFVALENPSSSTSSFKGVRGVSGIYRGELGIVKASGLTTQQAQTPTQEPVAPTNTTSAVKVAMVAEDANLRKSGDANNSTNFICTIKAGSLVEYDAKDDVSPRTTVHYGKLSGTLVTYALRFNFTIESGQTVYVYQDGVLVRTETKKQ